MAVWLCWLFFRRVASQKTLCVSAIIATATQIALFVAPPLTDVCMAHLSTASVCAKLIVSACSFRWWHQWQLDDPLVRNSGQALRRVLLVPDWLFPDWLLLLLLALHVWWEQCWQQLSRQAQPPAPRTGFFALARRQANKPAHASRAKGPTVEC